MTYYGFLARHVPPSRILATAARRAVRLARNRLAPPLAPDADGLLAALGCDGPDALAALLARPRPARPPWTPGVLVRAFERHLPGERERALARADAAAEGRVRVYGRWVEARRPDGGLDWHLDAVNGGRFPARAPSAALPPSPGLDVKAAWALGRGEHWVALGAGAALDPRGGERLAEALSASVRDFARQNPVGQGVHWTCAMEVALRAWNLVQALWLLSIRRVPPDPPLALAAAGLLVASGRFVTAHLEDDTAVPNNHLTTDWLGLLACAEGLPEWPDAPRWRALALEGLRQAAAAQVLPDGFSFEGSVPYHRFSLELFTCAAVLSHAARHGLGAPYATRLRRMFQALRALTASSGDLPQLGDNDSGHALTVRERGPTEAGYLLPLGAALFRSPALLVERGTASAAEAAWLLGPRALEWLARARPGPPRRSSAFPHGGYHAVRRGRLEAFVSCGPAGQAGIGGHNHNDRLSFELRVGGVLAVSDPGMPVYGRDPAQRNRFRSTAAHATVAIDGLEQVPFPPGRLFALPDEAHARLLAFTTGGPADHLAGEHRGYLARAGVLHQRDLWATEAGLVVVDALRGEGLHRVALRWPLAPDAAHLVAPGPRELAALARLAAVARLAPELDRARAVEVPLGRQGRLLIAFACPPGLAVTLGPATRSPGYAELVEGAEVLLSGPVPCPATLLTLFLHLPEEGSPHA